MPVALYCFLRHCAFKIIFFVYSLFWYSILFRFYGRIAINPNSHDEETLNAIKENGQGLKDISGERIWMELKRILEGNFAGELMLAILECDLGPYIGKKWWIKIWNHFFFVYHIRMCFIRKLWNITVLIQYFKFYVNNTDLW